MSNVVPKAPPKIAAVSIKELRLIPAIPVIPCPLVHPPPILAPKTKAKAPTSILTHPMPAPPLPLPIPSPKLTSAACGDTIASISAPTTIPAANTILGVAGNEKSPFVHCQNVRPRSSKVALTPIALPVRSRERICAAPMARPPVVVRGQGEDCGA